MRPFRSLHFKVAAGVIVTILALSAADVAFDYFLYRQQLSEELEVSSANLAKISLQGLLELAMLGRHPELLQGAIERLGRDSEVADVLLLNREGEVRFASDPDRIGRRFEVSDEGCRGCHRAGTQQPPSSIFVTSSGTEVLRTAAPVPNRKECHPCHSARQAVNGVLVIDFSTAKSRARLQRHLQEMLAKTGVTVLSILIVLGVLMNRVVIRRIKVLTQAARRLINENRAAALDNPVQGIDGTDEIGQLTLSFQEMVSKLTASIRELDSQKSYLQGLTDSLQDGLLVVDPNLVVEHVNPAASEIWKGRKLRGLKLSETPLAVAVEEVRRTFEQGMEARKEVRWSDGGSDLFVEFCCSAVRGEDESVRKALVLFRDVTERKALEQQVSRGERLASVGQLAAGVAHEINNPMAAVTTCVEGLERYLKSIEGLGEEERREVLDYLGTIGEAALRCTGITQRLLSLSSDPGARELSQVDLRDVVQEVVKLVEHQARSRDIEISASFEGSTLLLGDAGDLYKLVLNLLLNSVEAVGEKGCVAVSATGRNGSIELLVSDNGCGIPEKHLERLFDPFFTSKRSGRGTGLGLSICEGIVRGHGGRISVHSEVGRGTQIGVVLPREQLGKDEESQTSDS